jgi:ankyrin repeat protein
MARDTAESSGDAVSVEAYGDLVPAVERTLSASLGGDVRVGSVVRTSEATRRNQLLRCALAAAPAGAPGTVMVKRRRPADYDPENHASFATRGLYRDWAGLEFLTGIGAELVGSPRFYGGDRAAGFVVMEDLGQPKGLDHYLLEGSAEQAERGLVLLATTLGRMHAATLGREAEYDRIRGALGPGDGAERRREEADEVRRNGRTLLERCSGLGVATPGAVERDLEAVAASVADPGPFLAYTHGDPCPDNNALSLSQDGPGGDRFRLIDFEIGGYRHALRDGVYGRIRFPTCWCVRDLPEDVIRRMEDAYRAELVKGCPAAADDVTYLRALAEGAGAWVVNTVTWSVSHSLDYDLWWGVATHRQRVLMRLAALAELTRRAAHLEALGETAARLGDALRARWEPFTLPVAGYPAFTAAGDPPPVQVDALAHAIDAGDVAAARAALEETPALVRAEARDAGGRWVPMLTRAVGARDVPMVRLLLERRADWRFGPRSGAANLVLAAETAPPEVVALLLEHGALPDARDANGFRPLHVAARAGRREVVDLLLAHGAEPDALAAIYLDRFEDAARILREDPDQAGFRFGNGSTLLHRVARHGDPAARYVPLLVEHGAPLEATVWSGHTALHAAAEEGHLEVARALLAAGAAAGARTQEGATPLTLAEASGHTAVAALLREASERSARERAAQPELRA